MKTLLLDNYDSFSHILFQYLWEVNGEKPLFVRNDAWTLERIKAARFDNILISPGPGRPDIPADFGVCAEVIRAFPDVPILGVCLGHQGLGLAAGAVVSAAPEPRHGKPSRIRHDGSGVFAGLPQGFEAVRYHSLAVDSASLPPDLAVTATAEDDGQIMGLRLEKRPCYGVQFHPESFGTAHGKALLANFRDLTGGHGGGLTGRRPMDASPSGPAPASSSGPAPAAPVAPPPTPSHPLTPAPPLRPPAAVPMRELPWRDPEAAFHRLFAGSPAAFWLDSLAAPVPGEALISYMGSGIFLHEVRGGEVRTLEVGAEGGAHGAARVVASRRGDPFVLLRKRLEAQVTCALPFDFRGGLVGWLGYELKRHAGGGDRPETPPSDLPDALLLEPARLLAFDHAARKVWAVALPAAAPEAFPGTDPQSRAAAPEDCPGEAAIAGPTAHGAATGGADGRSTTPGIATSGGVHPGGTAAPADLAWLESLAGLWPSLGEAPRLDLRRDPAADGAGDFRLPWTLSASREAYLESIRSLQASIRAGETYEACLTNELRIAASADPWMVYRILRRTNPAPYAAYFRFPQASILGASPERFLKLDAGGRLACRPIKGTRRRGATPAEDARLKADLAGHPKDRSENLMIVDLVRNDFGRVCALGTVAVPEFLVVEEHPTVFQLVSGVEGRLEPGVPSLEAVRACFPGGSMTGAPKKRTMELLEAREGRPRGVFSGALGWLGADGALDLGMVIRTLVHEPREGLFRIGCGGAILAESDPDAEFEEALLKADAPRRAVELAVLGRSGGWVRLT